MTGGGYQTGLTGLGRRVSALLGLRPRPTGRFVFHPEPYCVGNPHRGDDLTHGIFEFTGLRIEARDRGLFELPSQGLDFDDRVLAFEWLDHLAASGTVDAKMKAQAWTLDWVRLFGGQIEDPPDLTGRRVLRCLLHSLFLTDGMQPAEVKRLTHALGQQALYLRRTWDTAPPGLPRFEALTGLLFAGLCLEGLNGFVSAALKGLNAEAASWVDQGGGIPTRNPEELLRIFCLLVWSEQALAEVHRAAGVEMTEAVRRMAPTLRGLRHADGALARLHSGGRGPEGWLDYGLAQAGVRGINQGKLSMGVARFSALRTTLLVDCAAPPSPVHAQRAHASTLSFELTSGRRPIIVSCGAGEWLGPEWGHVSRQTAAHSTLEVGRRSFAQFDTRRGRGVDAPIPLVLGPQDVRVEMFASELGKGVEAWHDGYRTDLGLVHSRQLALSSNGRVLAGQDTLAAVTDEDWDRFARAQGNRQGLPFDLRFHLHPDVKVTRSEDNRVATLILKSGEKWVFRHDGHRALVVEESTYLERADMRPATTKQLILKGRVLKEAVQINWSLAKDDETPQGIRDLVRDGVSIDD